LDQSVDHHVAHKEDLLFRYALPRKIRVAIDRRSKKKVGQLICNQPVDFFRHRAVERAKPGLNMPYTDPDLGTDERGRNG